MSHTLRMTRVNDDEDGNEQLKGLTKEQMEQRIAHLTTQGDGSERQDNDEDEEEDNDQEPEYQIYQNIQEIIPGLFIGDYTAAIDGELLRSKGIQFVVAAMRQRYPVPEGIKLHRILIDDTSKTNIMRYFTESNALIREARSEGKNVLVHCQAGVSRSTTLCAAFLMEEFDLTADEAIEKIASVRSVVSPIEFFLHQLELFERCNYDLNPSKYPEYRRFLMNYNAQDMLDGDGVDQLILAYYPSPAPSPRRSPGLPDPFLSMTPMSGATTPGGGNAHSRRGSSNSISSQEARSEILARVRRGSFGAGASATLGMTAASNSRRMSEGQSLTPGGGGGGLAPLTRRKSSRTKSTGERDAELAKLRALLDEKKRKEAEELAAKMQKNGAGPSGAAAAAKADPNAKVVHMGVERDYTKERRLRCKMCRRDLAAREHILEHEPGQGQRAFAPNRRDMTQHRLDTEKRRQDKAKEREARQAERQRLAAEAAEDLLLEAEDAVASGSEGSGDEEGPAGEEEAQTKAAPEVSSAKTVASSSRPPVSRPAPKSAPSGNTAPQGRPQTQQQQQQQQQQSSLASRLPPQLAGLRVAMPHRSMVHDLSNATHGSAIDDDDEAETPAASSPQQSKQIPHGGPGAGVGGPASPPLLPSSVCTSYFTEPLSWMQNQLENGELSGRILCPNVKCGAKLGTFDWSGLQCSCAAWICPGFALNASKVDEVKV